MINDNPEQLASYVRPEVTEGRIARQWAEIERRSAPRTFMPAGLFVRTALVLVPLVLCAIGIGVWTGRIGKVPSSGSWIESAQEPVSVRLRDGSTVELDAQTRLKLLRDQAGAVELELGDGRARFDVTHVPGRTFTVAAGLARVNVVGTRFDVARLSRPEGNLVQVAVTRGVVEVRRIDQEGSVRRLSAGEVWSVLLPNALPAQTVVEPRAETPAETSVDTSADKSDAKPEVVPAQDTVEDEAAPESDAAPENDTPSPEPRATNRVLRARAIFQRANLARRAGQIKDAAAAYAQLLRRYPHDARAAISAFELGRIRMDAFSDPRGAVTAFAQALQLAPSASFREDVLARIVVARDAMGDHAACKEARDRYMSSYPRGVHAVALAARCR